MKTIFITSFHPLLSRNILRTGILDRLSKNNKVIIFAPDYKEEFFRKEFSSENVEIIGVPKKPFGGVRGALIGLGALLLPVSTMILKRKEKFSESKNVFAFLGSVLFLKGIAYIPGIARVYRFLFRIFYNEKFFENFLSERKPDLIFAADILETNDIRLISEAKKRGIFVIGMVRSWDNLTNKGIMPVVPDMILVNNDSIQQELIDIHKVKKDIIRVVGMPQFDYYIGYAPTPREEFFKTLAFDPVKKVIMFAPMGSKFIESDWQILQTLHDAIRDGSIAGKPNLLVRFPPGDGIEHLTRVKMSPEIRVFMDRPGVGFKIDEKKDKEFGREDMVHLADSLYYSDILVNAGSSLCIDIAAFDKPIVFPAFDGFEKVPYLRSVKKLFEYHHYQYLFRTRACKMVYGKQELTDWVNKYLANPEIDADERKRLIEEQCWKHDGKAAERVARILLRQIA